MPEMELRHTLRRPDGTLLGTVCTGCALCHRAMGFDRPDREGGRAGSEHGPCFVDDEREPAAPDKPLNGKRGIVGPPNARKRARTFFRRSGLLGKPGASFKGWCKAGMPGFRV